MTESETKLIEELREVQKHRGDYHSWQRLDSHVAEVERRRLEGKK